MPHPFELPPFDGRMPAGTEMRVSGTSGSPTRAVSVGETVAVLIRGNVADVQHPEKVDGDGFASIVRRHVVKADRVYLLDRAEGDGLLELESRRAVEIRQTEEHLQTQLPGMETARDADSLKELDRYADRLDRQADAMHRLGDDLSARAAEIRDRVTDMRAKLAELDGVDPDTGEVLAAEVPLAERTLVDLRRIAQDIGIYGRSTMDKAGLVAAIRTARGATEVDDDA